MTIVVGSGAPQTTVIKIINLALKDINVLGIGETLEPETASDCLATLVQMIGQWRAEKLFVFAQQVVSFTAVSGQQTYTIGFNADINVDLPAKIDSAVWRRDGFDIPLTVIDSLQEYEYIDQKSMNTEPYAVFFQRSYPTGTVYVWPQSLNGGEIRLVVTTQLTEYTSLTDNLGVPNEYVLAMRYSLAELLAPSFGAVVTQKVERLAANARRVLKRNNTTVLPLYLPSDIIMGSYGYGYNMGY